MSVGAEGLGQAVAGEGYAVLGEGGAGRTCDRDQVGYCWTALQSRRPPIRDEPPESGVTVHATGHRWPASCRSHVNRRRPRQERDHGECSSGRPPPPFERLVGLASGI
jgi:hypothetical protein